MQVVVKLLQRIYGGEGYYCEWTSEVRCCSRSANSTVRVVSEIVSVSM
ncbi:MAG: hypothetical protein ACLTE2_07855 [Eubacteriales bacterium]